MEKSFRHRSPSLCQNRPEIPDEAGITPRLEAQSTSSMPKSAFENGPLHLGIEVPPHLRAGPQACKTVPSIHFSFLPLHERMHRILRS